MSFEEAIDRLDEIVVRLSDGNTSLEESLTLFSEGAKLIEQCDRQLTEATLTIETLLPNSEKKK